jgi:hypothetical protein
VVAQLSLQILSSNVEDGGDSFLELTVEAALANPRPDEASNLASFATRSLAFIVPRPRILRDICGLNVALASQSTPARHLSSGFGSLLQVSRENRQLVEKYLREELTGRLAADPTDESTLTLALYLTEIPGPKYLAAPLSRDDLRYWTAVERDLYSDVHEALVMQSQTRAWCAVLRSVLGELPISDVVVRHGVIGLYQFRKAHRQIDAPIGYLLATGLPRSSIARSWKLAGLSECGTELGVYLPTVDTPWITTADPELYWLWAETGIFNDAIFREPVASRVMDDARLLTALPFAELSVEMPSSPISGRKQRYPDEEYRPPDREASSGSELGRLVSVRKGQANPGLQSDLESAGLRPATVDFALGWAHRDLDVVSLAVRQAFVKAALPRDEGAKPARPRARTARPGSPPTASP